MVEIGGWEWQCYVQRDKLTMITGRLVGGGSVYTFM